MVALPCGSRSTNSTRRFMAAKLAARLTLVVVLPTPPFWLATAMILVIRPLLRGRRGAAQLRAQGLAALAWPLPAAQAANGPALRGDKRLSLRPAVRSVRASDARWRPTWLARRRPERSPRRTALVARSFRPAMRRLRHSATAPRC